MQTLKGTIKYRLISSIKYRLLSSIKYQLVQIVCVPGKYSTQRRLFNELSQIPHKATLVVHLGTYDMPAQDIYHCLSQFHRYITTTTRLENIAFSEILPRATCIKLPYGLCKSCVYQASIRQLSGDSLMRFHKYHTKRR